jgi:hypothetical protein
VALFNRLLIIVLAIVMLVAAGAVLLTALGLVQPANMAPAGSWFVDRLVPFAQLEPPLSVWTVGVSLALVVLALLLLMLEVWPRSRAQRRITLKDDEIGRVTVALDGVRKLVEREAGRVGGIERARAHVELVPTGLQLACQILVDPSCSVPSMTDELRQRLKASVEHHVGLTVTQVSVDAQVAPLMTD